MIFNLIVFTIFLPAVTAGLIWSLSLKIWQKDLFSISWNHALAIGSAYLIGHYLSIKQPAFPPIEASDWVFYITIISMVIGMILAIKDNLVVLDWMSRLSILMGSGYLIAKPLLDSSESSQHVLISILVISLSSAFSWHMMEKASSSFSGASIPVTFLIVLTCSSIACVLGESASIGQSLGIITSAIGPAMILAWIKPEITFKRSAMPVIYSIWIGHLYSAYFYSDLPIFSLLLLITSPIFVFIRQNKNITQFSATPKIVLQSTLVAFFALLGTYLTTVSHPIETQELNENDPYYTDESSSDEDESGAYY